MKKIILGITALLMTSVNVHASFGGGAADTGGGNAVGSQLLDLYENHGTSPVHFEQLTAYNKFLKPLFAKLDQKVPGLSKHLESGTQGKVWLFDSKPLSRKLCLNSSMIEAAQVVVACQNDLEVRISKTWFDNVANQPDGMKQQAGLIIHELLRGLALKPSAQISDEGIAFTTRTLLSEQNYSDKDIASVLAKTKVGLFMTYSEYAVVNKASITPLNVKYCNERGQTTKVYQLKNDLYTIAYKEGKIKPQSSVLTNMYTSIPDMYRASAQRIKSKDVLAAICSDLNKFTETYR